MKLFFMWFGVISLVSYLFTLLIIYFSQKNYKNAKQDIDPCQFNFYAEEYLVKHGITPVDYEDALYYKDKFPHIFRNAEQYAKKKCAMINDD